MAEHPLAPLSENEIRQTAAVLRRDPRGGPLWRTAGSRTCRWPSSRSGTYGRALMPEQYRDRRLGWCDIWHRATPEGNPCAHPVSGLKLVVDMNILELLEIENDH